MIVLSDIMERCRIAANGTQPKERRVFAAFEAVFMPVSFLTLIALLVIPMLGWAGVDVSWARGPLVTIFVSAAIGYITNWIAIEMLFKPYHPTLKHLFAWITFGYWRQGLVPKNKGVIAEKLGDQAVDLLKPGEIANELCSMIGEALRNERVITSIRDNVQRVISAHDREIAEFLAPKIEAALVAEIDRLVTVEKVETFWTEHIEPRLQSVETRDEIANIIIAGLEKRAPSLSAKAKPLIVSAIEDCVRGMPAVGRFAGIIGLDVFAGTIADFLISRNAIEKSLRNWLHSPDTVPSMRTELLAFVQSARDYLKSESSRAKIGTFVGEIRTTFKDYVRSYIESNLAATAEKVLNSDSLWTKVAEMVPRFRPEIERLIRAEGIPLIMEKLDIKGRIQTAVGAMSVEEFHGMINSVAAQHLGAIQVLGYILGAAAGALTLLI